MVQLYNNTLITILNDAAPEKTQSVSYTRCSPWYTDQLRSMKAACRQLECKWRDSGLTVHFQVWKHLYEYRDAIGSARSTYFCRLIENGHGNPRLLFSTIGQLLEPNRSSTLSASQNLFNNFFEFFITKINRITRQVPVFDTPITSLYWFIGIPFIHFAQVTSLSLTKLVQKN
ncbi:hypothetical protein EOD39_13378 [Acipenser ruthenus]|uniref:Uncharacterized protein n=1 Tax=Acipenser ruthenus TaxID=7906 RepID=A0A662YPY1_ACIRT|nr:hypothetical protein EOD39_13378 [Acipenser ruthenus]